MKWSLVYLLAFIGTHQVFAHTQIVGEAAKDLYNLIPSKKVIGDGVPQNLAGIKIAEEVKCSWRINDTYKCLVPNTFKDGLVELGLGSSQIFYDVLNQRGLTTIKLGASSSMRCDKIINPIWPSQELYICTISL
jgi:hypothetical protein